jgi:hypothetical protein
MDWVLCVKSRNQKKHEQSKIKKTFSDWSLTKNRRVVYFKRKFKFLNAWFKSVTIHWQHIIVFITETLMKARLTQLQKDKSLCQRCNCLRGRWKTSETTAWRRVKRPIFCCNITRSGANKYYIRFYITASWFYRCWQFSNITPICAIYFRNNSSK